MRLKRGEIRRDLSHKPVEGRYTGRHRMVHELVVNRPVEMDEQVPETGHVSHVLSQLHRNDPSFAEATKDGGIVLSETAGNMQFHVNGAWTKRFQIGAASSAGILAPVSHQLASSTTIRDSPA